MTELANNYQYIQWHERKNSRKHFKLWDNLNYKIKLRLKNTIISMKNPLDVLKNRLEWESIPKNQEHPLHPVC